MSNYDEKEKRALAVYVLIFTLLTLGIAVGGYFSYRNFEQEFRRQVGKQISAIAELKMDQLVNWRRERMGDAQSFYRNPVFSGLVESYLENPADVETRKQITSRLEYYQSYAGYESISLLDINGIHRLIIPSNPEELEHTDSSLMSEVSASLISGNIIFGDFQVDTDADGQIKLSILVPVFAEQSDARPLGVLVLHINPETYLYPYINKWPVPSDTAETLLVRRDGKDALFLNQVRFEKNVALNLRLPLTKTDIPAVKAVLGQIGLVEGMDYRGHPVLADIRPVPDSPWFLISKMDIDEVYTPLRERLWQTFLIVGMAIFVAGLGLVTDWRQQRVFFYRAKAEMAEELRESEEKFRKAFVLSPDSIIINRLQDGMYISINNGFSKIMGYAADEVIGKTSLELNIWADPRDRQLLVDGLKKTGEVDNLEARFRAKNGGIKYGLMSASVLELNGVQHIISITRDITERRQAAEELDRQITLFRNLFESSPEAIAILDHEDRVLEVNRSFETLYGYLKTEAQGRHINDLLAPGMYLDDAQDISQVVIGNGQIVEKESIRCTKDGHPVDVSIIGYPIVVDRHMIGAYAIYRDITERKRTEEALRESEEKMRSIFRVAPTGIGMVRNRMLYEVNPRIVEMTGYAKEELIGQSARILYPSQEEFEWVGREKYAQIAQKGSGVVETRWQKKDGTIIEVLLASTPIDLADLSRGVTFTALDITERKQAEEALRESETRYRTLFSDSPIPLLEEDFSAVKKNIDKLKKEGVKNLRSHFTQNRQLVQQLVDMVRVVDVNKATLKWHNITNKEMLLGSLGKSIGAEAHGNFLDELMALIDNRTQYEITVSRTTKEGQPLHLIISGMVALGSEDSWNRVLVSILDITERKQAEEELRENRALFSSLVESLPQNVFSKDLNGRFTFANRHYCEAEGKPLADILGKTDFDLHPADLAQQYLEDDRYVIEMGQIIEKVEIHQPLGVEMSYMQVTKAPIRDSSGQIKGLLGIFWDITDRKRAEEALRESEQLLRKMNENSPLGMHFYKLEGDKLIFTGANPAADKLLGVDHSQFIGKTIEEAFPPLAQTKVPQCYREAALNGIPWSTEQISYADGQINGAFEVRAFQTIQQNMVAVFADITARKQAEEALRESEQRYKLVSELTSDYIYKVSIAADGKVSLDFVTDSFQTITGRSREEAGTIESWNKIIYSDDLPKFLGFLRKLLATRQPGNFECRSYIGGGQMRWIEVIARPEWDEQEGRVTAIVGAVKDISERKQAEEDLRESEALYRQAIAVADAVPYRQKYHVNDRSIYYEFIGEGIRQITGYGPEEFDEVIWDSLIQESVLLGDLAGYSWREAINRVRSSSNPVWRCEHRIRARDGSLHWVFEAAVELRDENGIAHGSIGLFQDITARKQAEEEIHKLNVELEQRVRERTLQLENTNKELEAFSYSVSHDLRAPLRGIDGWSQAILEDYHDKFDEQGREYIRRVRSETQRMGRLIDDMLQLSRLTRAEMVSEQVDLSALAQSVAARLKQNDPLRQVEFIIQMGIVAEGDSHLLEIVFDNLLGNAFKFTSKCAEACIEFGQTELHGQHVFFVRDNGAGFDMNYSQKLFGAFQRMHKTSEFPGTGVGLATVQRIVHRHGGRIWTEAEVGRGASFYFTLEENS